MNCCFYIAIDRLPLGTVAAIEFLPVIALAALGARTPRNAAALALAVPGVYLLSDVQLAAEPLGLAFAFANALLFAAYIVLADRVAEAPGARRASTASARAMLVALVVRHADRRLGRRSRRSAIPSRCWRASASASRSSVIPYVSDQLALRAAGPRDLRAAGLAAAGDGGAVIGIVVLAQVPSAAERAGIGAGRRRRRDAARYRRWSRGLDV